MTEKTARLLVLSKSIRSCGTRRLSPFWFAVMALITGPALILLIVGVCMVWRLW